MILRTRFLITMLILCHQLLASGLVTRQLLSASDENGAVAAQKKSAAAVPPEDAGTACAQRAATQLKDGTIICAIQQEKIGDIYKLHGEAEIHYQNYVLRADEATYDSDSGEATASGHFRIDGGLNDDRGWRSPPDPGSPNRSRRDRVSFRLRAPT